MKKILLQILHYIWFRKNNIYSAYKAIVDDPNIKIDGKLDFKEFEAYIGLLKKSGATAETFDDENIVSGDILGSKILENTSKNLVQNEQGPIDCVPRSLIRMIRLNTHADISQKKEQEYIDDMYRRKIISGTGSKISVVQNYLKNAIKRDFDIDLVYFRTPYGSSKYNELMGKGYAHTMGGGLSELYVADFLADGDIDIENYTFREKVDFYHVFTHLPENFSQKGNIVENYVNTFGVNNIYKNDYVRKFASRRVFFGYGYFFLEKVNADILEKRLEAEKEKIRQEKEKTTDSWELATQYGIVNGKNRDQNVTRYEVAVMIIRAMQLLAKEIKKLQK